MRRFGFALALAILAGLALAAPLASAQTSFPAVVDSWSTTVATGGYTPGAGTIPVASTSGLSSASGTWYRFTAYRGTSPTWTKLGHFRGSVGSSTSLSTVSAIDGFADVALLANDTLIIQPAAAYLTAIHGAINAAETGKAPLASPALTGTPTAPTPSTGDSSTAIATTAFVKAQAYAPLASPALTGTPTGPTATPGTNTTQLATTAFVAAAVAGSGGGSGSVTSVALTLPSIFSLTGSPITTSGTLAASLATQAANTIFAGPTTGSAAAPTFRALVAADVPNIAESQVTNLTSDLAAKAPLASPALTGTPTAPTATPGTNTTQLATTAFVAAATSGGGSVSIGSAVGGSPTSGGVLYTDASGNLAQSTNLNFNSSGTLKVTGGTDANGSPALIAGASGQSSQIRLVVDNANVPNLYAWSAGNFIFHGGAAGSQWLWDSGPNNQSTFAPANHSSGIDVAADHNFTIGGSGTQGYIGHRFRITENSVGSGAKAIAQFLAPDGATAYNHDRYARPAYSGTPPTIAAGTGAGTSPSTPGPTGNDVLCTITLTTGTSPATSAAVATITYAQARDSAVPVILSPGNAAAAALSGGSQVYVDSATLSVNGFTIKVGASGLAASTTYVWFARAGS